MATDDLISRASAIPPCAVEILKRSAQAIAADLRRPTFDPFGEVAKGRVVIDGRVVDLDAVADVRAVLD